MPLQNRFALRQNRVPITNRRRPHSVTSFAIGSISRPPEKRAESSTSCKQGVARPSGGWNGHLSRTLSPLKKQPRCFSPVSFLISLLQRSREFHEAPLLNYSSLQSFRVLSISDCSLSVLYRTCEHAGTTSDVQPFPGRRALPRFTPPGVYQTNLVPFSDTRNFPPVTGLFSSVTRKLNILENS